MIAPSNRRAFLRGLVSLPLIGGGVTLIGQPAAAVPLIQAAALPTLADPRQRALYAWEAFASAMDDVTTGTAGWRVRGAGRIAPCAQYEGVDFLNLTEVYFEDAASLYPRAQGVIERGRDFALDPAEDALVQASNFRKAAHRAARELRA